MATDDTRGRQGAGNSMAPNDDPNYPQGQPKVRPGAANPGESDSTSNDSGAHNDNSGQSASDQSSGTVDNGAEASSNGGTTASADNGGTGAGGDNSNSTAGTDTADNTGTTAIGGDTSAAAGGGDTGAAASGSDASAAAGGSDTGATAGGGDTTATAGGGGSSPTAGDGGTDTSAGGGGTTTTAGGGGDGGGSDHGPALGLPVIGDLGLDGLGNGLIHDAVADTQSMAGGVLGDLRAGGSDLVTDLINGTDQLLGNAADHLGLGGVVGDNFVADTASNLTGLTGLLPGNIGGGLIHDAVADTQSLAGTALGNATGSGGSLLTDVVNGTQQLADHAVSNLGIGDTGNLLGSATGDIGNINVASLLGDGPLVNGSLLNGDGAIVNPLSQATGGVADGLLGSSTGDGPLAAVGIVGDGSPAISNVLGGTGDGVLSGLGIGQIAKVAAGDHDADNNPAISASAGNHAGDNGPVVNAHAFSDNSTSSGNLIDLNTGPDGGASGSSSGIIANVLGGSADDSNPLIDGNLISTNGQTAANADVLTSPDQFHFPALNGIGSDSLSGALGTGAGQVATGAVPDATPVVNVGTDPLVDINLAGEPHAADAHNSQHSSLVGQLLGSA